MDPTPPLAPVVEPVIHAYIQIQLRGTRDDVEWALSDISRFAKQRYADVYAGETREEGL